MEKNKKSPVFSPQRLTVWDGPSRRELMNSLVKNKTFKMFIKPLDAKNGTVALKVETAIYAARKRGLIEDHEKKMALTTGSYNERADYGEKELRDYFVNDEWMVEGVFNTGIRLYRFVGYLNTNFRKGLIIEKEVISFMRFLS